MSFYHLTTLFKEPIYTREKEYRKTLIEIMIYIYYLYLSNCKQACFPIAFHQTIVNFRKDLTGNNLPRDCKNIRRPKLSLFCLSTLNRWPIYRRTP